MYLGAGGVELRGHLVREHRAVRQPRLPAGHPEVVQRVWVAGVERQRPLVQPDAALRIACYMETTSSG